MIKFTVLPKKSHLALEIWQNWCYGQFYHSKTEMKTLGLSHFSLVTCFFEGTRENILQIHISGQGQFKTVSVSFVIALEKCVVTFLRGILASK